MRYKAIIHEAPDGAPKTGPWAAYADGYVEYVPVGRRKNANVLKRTERWRWFRRLMVRILGWGVRQP